MRQAAEDGYRSREGHLSGVQEAGIIRFQHLDDVKSFTQDGRGRFSPANPQKPSRPALSSLLSSGVRRGRKLPARRAYLAALTLPDDRVEVGAYQDLLKALEHLSVLGIRGYSLVAVSENG